MAATTAFTIFGTAVTYGAIATYVATTLISYAITAVFSKKPKSGSAFAQDAQDRLHTVRNATAPGRVVFGRAKVGGVPDFIHSASHTSSTTGPVTEEHVIPAGSPSVRVYVGRTVVSVTSVVTRVYDPPSESYFDVAFSATSGTPGQGQYVFDGANFSFNEADIGKSVKIDYTAILSTTVSKYLHMVIELACHECEAIEEVYLDDELIPLDPAAPEHNGFHAAGRLSGGWAYVSKFLGSPDQQADPSLMTYAPDKWTASHRLRNRTGLYVRLLRDVDKFPNGMPNITAVVKGYKPLDPRTGLRTWTDNWALCLAGFLADAKFGLGHGYVTEIDNTLLISAADASDESVTLASGGTEKRYTVNGSFLTDEQPKDILGRLKVAGAGHCVRVGGKWRIYAGAYITPTVTLTQDHLRGPIQVKPRLSKRDLFNGVKGIYVSESNSWQPADFPAVTNSTYLSEDNNERNWLDIDAQFTTSSATAQRIAKIELERVRQQITVMMPCKLSAYAVEPPRTVMLTLSQFGWTSKVFEVTQTDLVVNADDEGNQYMGVDLTLRETALAVWDWNSGMETTVDPAPDTNLPNPFDVAPPGIPSVREEQYEGFGLVRVRAIVEWAPSPDGQAGTYDHEYKLIDATAWTQHAGLSTFRDTIEDIAPGTYDSRVRTRSRLGVNSTWVQTRYSITGLEAAPATPVIRGLQAIGGMALLTLDPHPDLDVSRAGLWRVRHTEALSSALWEESFSIGEEQGYPGSNTILVLPLKAGSYLVKAQDQGGQQSAAFAAISTKQASIHAFTVTNTITESTTFPGTHSNTVAAGGLLKLDAAGLFDSITDFDSVVSLDATGGIQVDGTYTFSAGFNFAAIAKRRLTGHIDGLTVNEFDIIDSRSNNIDDWLDFDGTAGGGSADAWLEYRETDTDPTGSPVWSGWRRLDAAEVEAWGVQIRLRMTSDDPAYNLHIDTLSVVAAQVV